MIFEPKWQVHSLHTQVQKGDRHCCCAAASGAASGACMDSLHYALSSPYTKLTENCSNEGVIREPSPLSTTSIAVAGFFRQIHNQICITQALITFEFIHRITMLLGSWSSLLRVFIIRFIKKMVGYANNCLWTIYILSLIFVTELPSAIFSNWIVQEFSVQKNEWMLRIHYFLFLLGPS